MPFKVEDGSGFTDSNVYCDIGFADDYHTTRGNADWAGEDTEKMAWIVRGADYMRRWAKRWKGRKTFVNQAMDWPRYRVIPFDPYLDPEDRISVLENVVYGDGAFIPDNVIPDLVKQANAELALRAMAGPIEEDLDRGGAYASMTNTLGPMTESISFRDNAPVRRRILVVEDMLRPLFRPRSLLAVARVIRA